MLRFTDEPLLEVHRALTSALSAAPFVEAEVMDPDLSVDHYDGERIIVGEAPCRYRSWAAWGELAARLGCALLTPERQAGGWVRLRLRALNPESSWHRDALPAGDPEKYGADSEFARIDKFEDPAFLSAWINAMDFLAPPPDARALSLGCHTGAELAALTPLAPRQLLGVDHSASAIAEATRRHPAPPFEFRVRDLAAEGPPPGRFDLIIAVNVLHSPALPGQALFRALVTEHLAEGGRLLLGWPNARYVDHRLRWGAAARHARGPELSVLLNDVMYHRRYLHQHRFRTQVTGKHTVLLAGRRLKA